MAFNQERLAGPAFVASTATSTTAPASATYTPDTGVTTIVKQMMLSNITANAQVVTVWLKPNGITLASSHILFHSLTLAANETVLVNMSLVMNESDSIFARTGTSSAVTITLSGIEES